MESTSSELTDNNINNNKLVYSKHVKCKSGKCFCIHQPTCAGFQMIRAAFLQLLNLILGLGNYSLHIELVLYCEE